MEESTLSINDYAMPAPVVTKITVNVVEVELNSHAVLRVSYYDSNGSPLDHKTVRMEGADYNAWGNDDEYVTTFALSKLGLTKKA
jgi:hypothetical protein